MNQPVQIWIEFLEREWSESTGFLAKARKGVVDQHEGEQFLEKLKRVEPPDEATIDRRFVALIWYIPMFLSWQVERVTQQGGDGDRFQQLVNHIQSRVEEILGVP